MCYDFIGEDLPCNLCGSYESEIIATKDRDNCDLTTVICKECGLVYTNPMPTVDEVAQYYGQEYRKLYKKAISPPLKHTYRTGLRCLERFKRVSPYLKDGIRVLDLGASSGEFVYLIKSRGYEAIGVEPNEGYGTFAKETLDVNIQISPFEKADIEPESIDIITAHHVIEHLVDPKNAFEVIARWLKPGGLLIAEVPNANAVYHAPNTKFHFAHVYNYTPTTFAAVGDRAGLGCIDLMLTPETSHVNAIFKKGSTNTLDMQMKDEYRNTLKILKEHDLKSHYLSAHPYKRVANNISRPFREKLALKNKPANPRELLDTLYQ